MRILLIGEYSGFHNALKHGLLKMGHEVTLAASGDGFKKYPVDVDFSRDYFDRNAFRKKIKAGYWQVTGKDLNDAFVESRFRESVNRLKDYDIIQFINSNALGTPPAIEKRLMEQLLEQNGKAFLVACGDDYPYSNHLVNHHKGYSILDPYKEQPDAERLMRHTLKYLIAGYKENYLWLRDRVNAIIPSNTDYYEPLIAEAKATQIIKAPVVTESTRAPRQQNVDRIHIFMGVNRENYWKKGINYFEAALRHIKKLYGNKVVITTAENMPYRTYINSYDSSHIVLDQVLCYDQGYNALEAMLRGKVVFAGGGAAYKKAHGLSSVPVIDARPDVDYLTEQLAQLIENPEKIEMMGRQAREHVLKYHDSVAIARKFMSVYDGVS